MMNFESSVYVSEQLNRQMVNAAQELAVRAVTACARHYDFDCDEALRMLGIVNAKVINSKRIEVKEKVAVLKAAFPLPYNGELLEECCYALRQNNGLYTQCQGSVKGDTKFCKQCKVLADKGVDGVPEYGTIKQRMEVGIFEYVDPKGRKPVAYTKVMKKYKITKEQAEEEALKFNININEGHFVVPEADSKRGRPSSNKAPKEAKGTKGRPKKAKKVIQIEGDTDDLFAALVADANEAAAVEDAVEDAAEDAAEEESDVIASTNISKKKNQGNSEEKEAKRLKDKEEREVKRLKEKEEREAKLAADKAEKEVLAKQKKEAERQAREAKEAEKLALAKQKKESKLASEKSKKPEAKADDDKEEEVVKKIEFEGNKYLKSKKTGIVYDYNEYVKNGEQVVIGKWNDTNNKIEFSNSGEESEEEYEA
jgi:hypothetical protein